MKTHCKKPARGFALIEALVAMLVVSFGMLAVAGFQITLSLNSDVAKQRTEATRLAQQKLEQLRTFDTLKDTLTAYETKMVSSTSVTQETITTNASFTRSWGITNANTPDTGRSTAVTVSWTDRAGNAQQVQLLSHVSATSPLLTGSLFFPLPDGTILRRPKNRSIDIPIPAISISGTGKSYIPWTGTGGGYLVFSDNSGDIVQKCSATPTADSLTTDTCTTFDGYLLTGYITGIASKVALVTNIKVPFQNQYVNTNTTPECSVGPAYDQTTSSPTPIADTKYYVCLIQPIDNDTNASTARVWSGRVDLAGATNASLAGTQVCRFSTDANTTVNNNHPATYLLVDRSLDNQNFYISSGNCAEAASSRVLHLINTGASSVTVIYKGNGNTGGTEPADNNSYALDAAVTVQPAGTLVKSDFTFAGWNTAANGSGTSHPAASTFFITDDTILYAQWTSTTPSTPYTVTYDSNGGTGTVPQVVTYAEGSTVTVVPSPSPTRSGYTFSGWSLSTTGSVVARFTITANTTLYAQWVAIPTTYTVSYSANGGTGTVPTDATAYTSGSIVTVIASPVPTRSGYTFGGWSLSTTGSAVPSFIITAPTTLYARWVVVSLLSTPAPVWPAGNSNSALTWSNISGASGYKIKICTPGTSNGTCTPSTADPTTSATTYTPSLTGNSSVCISVTATDSTNTYGDSSASSTKCVSRSGSTYTHY